RGPAAGMFFPVPARPDIAMSPGKNYVRKAFHNFRSHLHGLKRNRKKHPRRGTTQKRMPKAAAGADAGL
ncbi:hypothetical protein HMPREF1548_04565, partial [Clostridium sp. KLE 1755]